MQVPPSCEVELLGEICSSFSVVCSATLCQCRAHQKESPRAGGVVGRVGCGGHAALLPSTGAALQYGRKQKNGDVLDDAGGAHHGDSGVGNRG